MRHATMMISLACLALLGQMKATPAQADSVDCSTRPNFGGGIMGKLEESRWIIECTEFKGIDDPQPEPEPEPAQAQCDAAMTKALSPEARPGTGADQAKDWSDLWDGPEIPTSPSDLNPLLLRDKMKNETRRWRSQRCEEQGDAFIPNYEWDAFGHCWAGCQSARTYGASNSRGLGITHELMRECGLLGGPDHDSLTQDLANQNRGTVAGVRNRDLPATRSARAWRTVGRWTSPRR